MYVAVDIGGSKTLIAAFNEDGQMVRHHKFLTPKDYKVFLEELGRAYKQLDVSDATAAGVAVPGRLDRRKGMVIACGNLAWKNLPIEQDIKEVLGVPTTIENDAKLAALSESQLVIHDYKKVLYITISTGIGAGLTINGKIARILEDMEGGRTLGWHDGKLERWENFASGKAIHKHYGKLASEIPAGSPLWEEISANMAPGIYNLLTVLEPEVVIIGGGVGAYLSRFQAPLLKALKTYENPLAPTPPIMQAQRPDDAVIYGCYELVNQEFREHYG